MKKSPTTRNLRRLITFCVVFCALTALPLLSSARSSNSVNIVNNSNRVITHVYLSHVNIDDWGSDQLGGTVISPGQSFELTNFACDQQQMKVIGEDQEGCFLSSVVACGDQATWTITNDTAANCGQ